MFRGTLSRTRRTRTILKDGEDKESRSALRSRFGDNTAVAGTTGGFCRKNCGGFLSRQRATMQIARSHDDRRVFLCNKDRSIGPNFRHLV